MKGQILPPINIKALLDSVQYVPIDWLVITRTICSTNVELLGDSLHHREYEVCEKKRIFNLQFWIYSPGYIFKIPCLISRLEHKVENPIQN